MEAWVNGEFKPWEEVTVPVLSFSMGRGVSIFEVLQVVETDDGPACLCLDEHVNRFFNSARLIKMELPLSKEEMAEAVLETCRRNDVTFGVVKWLAYFPAMDIFPVPSDKTVEVAVFAANFDHFGVDGATTDQPVNIGITRFRKLHPESVPLQAKVCGTYINAYLSKLDVLERGYQDVLQLGTDGLVAEGITHNIFFVKGETVVTPPLTNILEGTTRKLTVEVIKDLGIELIETDIRPEEIEGFDEAFFSSSIVRVQPIASIDGRKVGRTCPGPVTAKVMNRFAEVLTGRVEKFKNYLVLV